MDLRVTMIQYIMIFTLILSPSLVLFSTVFLENFPSLCFKQDSILAEFGAEIWWKEAASVSHKIFFLLLGEEVLEE